MGEVTISDVRKRTFYGELAAVAAILRAGFMADTKVKSDYGNKGDKLLYYPASVFEHTITTLWQLGLAKRTLGQDSLGEAGFANYVLAMDAQDMPDFLREDNSFTKQRQGETLEMFLGIADHFGTISPERSPFKPEPESRKAMLALVQLGYALQQGDYFYWTDQVGTAMQNVVLWDKNLCSWQTIGSNELEATAQLAWRTIPEAIRERHFINPPIIGVSYGAYYPIDSHALQQDLMEFWRDNQWHHSSQKSKNRDDTRAIGKLADRIIEIAYDTPLG